MSRCKHTLAERETACADGMCPLCLALKLDRYQWTPEAYEFLMERVKQLEHENDQLRSRLGSAEQDAARYRWLKENHLQLGPDCWIRTGEDLGEAIDAELSKAAGEAASSTAERECEHEWVDARNSVVTSGEWCCKCNAVRAGEGQLPKGDRFCGTDDDFTHEDWCALYASDPAAGKECDCGLAERVGKGQVLSSQCGRCGTVHGMDKPCPPMEEFTND